ncbi:MAG: RNA polymerase sigma factor [Candidatus Sungbacteria bacterium]|nr:RNA polymerase sigma factor [Candidatus Sungbacteria bacterium]
MKKSYLDEAEEQKDPDDLKDEEILRVAQDEPAVFEMLVERYRQPLMRAALRVVKGREEAEDIVQETFVKIYKNAHQFQKLEGIEFKSWAYKVAINTAITHYRKLKRGEFLSEDPSVFEKPSEEQFDVYMHERADAKSAIAETMAHVPQHLRSALEAYYFEDKSYQTIAHEHDISIPTLKMRLFRAKRIFKKLSDAS